MPRAASPAPVARAGARKHAIRRYAPLAARERDRIPKYVQLASILQDKIARREYALNEQFPTEDRLCREYRVSRITVREAVSRLVQDGLVERRQGKGTYVVAQKLRRNIAKVYSFSHDMVHLGLRPSSVVLVQAVEQASPEVAAVLKMPEADGRVTRIERVRKANGVAILIERTPIPTYLCPGLERVDRARGSPYEALTQRYGVFPQTAEETYEAIILPSADATRLGYTARRPQPAFAIQRVTFRADGTPIELTRTVGRGDRLTLGLNMVADQADFQRLVGVTPGS